MSDAIEIGGIVRNTTKLTGRPGQMEEIINLRRREGVLMPLCETEVIWAELESVTGSYSQLFLHTGATYKHILGIRKTTNEVWYVADANGDHATLRGVATGVVMKGGPVTVHQIGNLVVIADGLGPLRYLLWYQDRYEEKDVTQGEWLNGQPRIRIKPAMDADGVPEVFLARGFLTESGYGSWGNMRKNDIEASGLSVIAQARTLAREKGVLNGFCIAVVVLRLYDGTYAYASKPVLLPQPNDSGTRYDDGYNKYDTNPKGCNVWLQREDEGRHDKEEYGRRNRTYMYETEPWAELYQAVDDHNRGFNRGVRHESGTFENTTQDEGSSPYDKISLYERDYEKENTTRSGEVHMPMGFMVNNFNNKYYLDDKNIIAPAMIRGSSVASMDGLTEKIRGKDEFNPPNCYAVMGRLARQQSGSAGSMDYLRESYTEAVRNDRDTCWGVVMGNTIQLMLPKPNPDMEEIISQVCLFISEEIYYADEGNNGADVVGLKRYVRGNYEEVGATVYAKPKTDEKIKEGIEKTGVFFQVWQKSYKNIESDEWIDIDLSDKLSVMEQMELLNVDASVNTVRNLVNAKCSYLYNGRLHIGDITEETFEGFDFSTLEQEEPYEIKARTNFKAMVGLEWKKGTEDASGTLNNIINNLNTPPIKQALAYGTVALADPTSVYFHVIPGVTLYSILTRKSRDNDVYIPYMGNGNDGETISYAYGLLSTKYYTTAQDQTYFPSLWVDNPAYRYGAIYCFYEIHDNNTTTRTDKFFEVKWDEENSQYYVEFFDSEGADVHVTAGRYNIRTELVTDTTVLTAIDTLMRGLQESDTNIALHGQTNIKMSYLLSMQVPVGGQAAIAYCKDHDEIYKTLKNDPTHGYMDFDVCKGWEVETMSDLGNRFAIVRIKTKEGIRQTGIYENVSTGKSLNPMLYYPDSRCELMTIGYGVSVTEGVIYYLAHEYKMKAFSALEGAIYVSDDIRPIAYWDGADEYKIDTEGRTWKRNTETDEWEDTEKDIPLFKIENGAVVVNKVNTTESRPNLMKVSATETPLVFPAQNTYQVGNGRIIGFCANTVALSTGQWGHEPLYAFCSDGVYAFSVDASGQMVYPNSRPISREVCNNTHSITPIDSAVVFSSERGLQMISGSQVTEISQPIEGRYLHFAETNHIDRLDSAGLMIDNAAWLQIPTCPTAEEAKEYLKGARIGWNYDNREIWAANPTSDYAYIFSEGKWSKVMRRIRYFIGDYPRTYYVDDKDGMVHDIARDDKTKPIDTMFVTRPIAVWGETAKTYIRAWMYGDFHVVPNNLEGKNRHKATIAVYGSHDGERFSLIGIGGIEGRTRDIVAKLHRMAMRYVRVVYVGKLWAPSRIENFQMEEKMAWGQESSTRVR